jgi:hypothetical protein
LLNYRKKWQNLIRSSGIHSSTPYRSQLLLLSRQSFQQFQLRTRGLLMQLVLSLLMIVGVHFAIIAELRAYVSSVLRSGLRTTNVLRL